MLSRACSRAARATARRLTTAAAGPPVPRFQYLSAWFCPYAHRATIALEHHSAHVAYDWEEALGWTTRPATPAETDAGQAAPAHDSYYHYKSDALKAANPGGLIPTLITDDGRAVWESQPCVEFVDETARASAAARPEATAAFAPLLPDGEFSDRDYWW